MSGGNAQRYKKLNLNRCLSCNKCDKMNNYESFVSMDLSNFTGEWVAIAKNKVVAHGLSFKEVYKIAKELNPGERPFIAKIRRSLARVL